MFCALSEWCVFLRKLSERQSFLGVVFNKALVKVNEP
jgi:hypothetical protein